MGSVRTAAGSFPRPGSVTPVASAVVTARNEAGGIEATVRALHGLAEIAAVTVVDDGSADGTDARARAAGAHVLRSRPMGKGRALEGALDLMAPAHVFVLVDGDLGSSAS